MNSVHVRTDLALEAQESVGKIDNLKGVEVHEESLHEGEIHVTKVKICTKNASVKIGKPQGNYITIQAPAMAEPDENYHMEISDVLCSAIEEMIPELDKELSVLVVGLGNKDITADALGPNVVDNLCVTRHIVREYGRAAVHNKKMNLVSAIVPGVMAKTGMETAEIVKGVADVTKPDVIIVIDALAARNMKRLNRTIQVTDTGIHPGSGVGNNRSALTQESLNVPVVAIGVPTVVDAATIVDDALEQMKQEREITFSDKHTRKNSKVLDSFHNMFVTVKDIDETVKRLGFTISEALNTAFYAIGGRATDNPSM